MQKDIITILIEKENRCKNLQKQARLAFEKHDMTANDEQCSFLQQAADLEFEMSTQTTGAERDHHIREKNRLDYEIMKIREEIDRSNPNKKKERSDDESKDKSSSKNELKRTSDDDELDRISRTWYKSAPAHSFNEVSGMSELKKKLEGCIEDKNARNLMDYLKIPRLNSYFFVGPPGCGKTYIIEAFAHELMDKDYKYISIQGSDIISRYVGAAEKNVTKLFEEAEKNAPCIVFIDEVDSLCKNRSLPNLPEYAANITTQFLTGYNRIHSADSETIFIAATNYPNRVDEAMLDRVEIVRVPLPDTEAREAAFEKYFADIIHLQSGFTFHEMAEQTKRYNYRDIERLVSAIKRVIFREMLDLFKIDTKAVEALENGKYKLTRTKFNSILEKFSPSPKEKILNDLKQWERDIQSITDYDDIDIEHVYESDESESSSIHIDEHKASEDRPVEDSEFPVQPTKEEFCPDSVSEKVKITFYVNGSPDNISANINGDKYDVEVEGKIYSLWYRPEADEAETEVFVRNEDGLIGSFTAKFGKAIAVNKDFDI